MSAPATAGGWRPIASAPKDGTPILAFVTPTWIEGMYYAEGVWRYLSDGDSIPLGRNAPIAWMPLPPAPEAP